MLVLLASFAFATVPPPDPEGPSVDTEDRLRWSALPNFSYDTDDKFGFGARLQIDLLAPGFDPYRASFVLHAFATTNGYHHHRFRFDVVGLGAQHRVRLTGHLAYRAWLNDGYWGIGNGTELAPEGTADDFYRYSLVQPFGHLTLRSAIGGPWSWYGAAEGRHSTIGVGAGSLLADERPFGLDGGAAVQVGGGILYDSREPEITPDRGALVEVSGRLVAMPDTVFGGPFASVRGWLRVVPGVVYAVRGMGEYLGGEVPFYELVHWGGFVPIAGFGGADTLRGVPFGRWRAPGKLLLNNELRLDVLRHRLFKEELRWQLVPFADVGAVFAAGSDASSAPPAVPFHPTAGLGVRPIWGETLVGRLDTAIGWTPRSCGVGCREPELSWGFYLMFDHLF